MELQNAIELIRNPGIQSTEKTIWADLGCGSGLFTSALAHLLNTGSKIYAIDSKAYELNKIKETKNIIIEKIHADFITDTLHIQNLDGILMANSLHFVKNKPAFINKISALLKPGGCFLIIEYNTDKANTWVPFPVSYASLKIFFNQAGYFFIKQIREVPSRYNQANIYASIIRKK
jgi:ubiquinone/menaquinone biosynthesis C-methylase UbiE